MCGIFGRVGHIGGRDGLRFVAVDTEHRGRDAAGLCWLNGDKLLFQKAPGPMSQLAKMVSGVWDSPLVIGHTRFATHGSPADNTNNHPFVGKRWVVVHNGLVFNYDKFDCKSECDSEAILCALEDASKDYTDAQEIIRVAIAQLEDCSAVAAIDITDKSGIWIWCNDTLPIHYATTLRGTLFASESLALRGVVRPELIQKLSTNTLARVTAEGLTTYPLPFKASFTWQRWYATKPYVHDDDDTYPEWREEWADEEWESQELWQRGKVLRFPPTKDVVAWRPTNGLGQGVLLCDSCALELREYFPVTKAVQWDELPEGATCTSCKEILL